MSQLLSVRKVPYSAQLSFLYSHQQLQKCHKQGLDTTVLPTFSLDDSYTELQSTPSLGAHQPTEWACRCLNVLSVIRLHSCHWFPTSSSSSPLPHHPQLWTFTLTLALPWDL